MFEISLCRFFCLFFLSVILLSPSFAPPRCPSTIYHRGLNGPSTLFLMLSSGFIFGAHPDPISRIWETRVSTASIVDTS